MALFSNSGASLWDQFIEVGLERGWHLKVGKWGAGGTASLLSHSLTVAGVAEQVFRKIGLPENEIRIGIATAFLHDFLKESHSSREEIERTGRLLDKEFTESDIGEISDILHRIGYDDDEIEIVASILTHGALQSLEHLQTILRRVPNRDLPRVRRLVHEVADPLASIKDLSEFERNRRRFDESLREWGLRLEYHQVSTIRGVTTSLCHRAIEEIYSSWGFEPILYYPEGTVYLGRSDRPLDTDGFRDAFVQEYWNKLESYIEYVPEENIVSAIIGPYNQSKIPTPEFAYASDSILNRFWDNIRSGNSVSDPAGLEKYIDVARRLSEHEDLEIELSDDAIRDDAIKELLGIFVIFYYFKEIRDHAFGDNGFSGNGDGEPISKLRVEYESTGCGERLDFEEFLEIIDGLSHSGVGVDEKILRNAARLRRLFPDDLLRSQVLDKAVNLCKRFSKILRPYAEKRKGLRATPIPEYLLPEIVRPFVASPEHIAQEIFNHYSRGKEAGGTIVCPVCGNKPEKEIRSKKVGKGESKSFTNFLIGGSTLQNRTICTLCDLEMSLRSPYLHYLQQGADAYEYYIIPQLNLSPWQMQLWANRIVDFARVKGFHGEDPLTRLDTWADQIGAQGLHVLNRQSKQMIDDLFRDEKNRGRKIRDRILRVIEKEYDGSTEEFIQSMRMRGESVDSLVEKILNDDPSLSPEIKELVKEWERGIMLPLITPNFFLLSFPVPKSETDDHRASGTVRHLFRGALLSRIFLASVIVKELKFEPLIEMRSHGAVKVPTDLHFTEGFRRTGIKLQNDWLSIEDTDRALEKIVSIFLVADEIKRAERSGKSRKGEYMMILNEPKGRTLNRIVQAQKNVKPDLRLFEQLDRIFS